MLIRVELAQTPGPNEKAKVTVKRADGSAYEKVLGVGEEAHELVTLSPGDRVAVELMT